MPHLVHRGAQGKKEKTIYTEGYTKNNEDNYSIDNHDNNRDSHNSKSGDVPFLSFNKNYGMFLFYVFFFLFACISSAGIVLLSSAAEVDLVTADSRLPNAGPVLLFNEVTTLRIRDD